MFTNISTLITGKRLTIRADNIAKKHKKVHELIDYVEEWVKEVKREQGLI